MDPGFSLFFFKGLAYGPSRDDGDNLLRFSRLANPGAGGTIWPTFRGIPVGLVALGLEGPGEYCVSWYSQGGVSFFL